MSSTKNLLLVVGFLICNLSLLATGAPDAHPCAPKDEPPDECHAWNDEDCKWESTCAEGEVCCGGSCVKVDSCNVCCGGEVIDTCVELGGAVSLNASGFKNIVALLKKSPHVKDASVSLEIKGELKGKKCCENDKSGVVRSGTGSFTASVSVTSGLPGWSGSLSHGWEGVYYATAEWLVGPQVTVKASGGGSVTNEYNECKNTLCESGSGSASVDLTGKFGGRIQVLVEDYRDTPLTHVEGEVTGSLTTSVTANTTWSNGDCSNPITQKVCWGGLTVSGQVSGKLVGVGTIGPFFVSKKIMDGDCL